MRDLLCPAGCELFDFQQPCAWLAVPISLAYPWKTYCEHSSLVTSLKKHETLPSVVARLLPHPTTQSNDAGVVQKHSLFCIGASTMHASPNKLWLLLELHHQRIICVDQKVPCRNSDLADDTGSHFPHKETIA